MRVAFGLDMRANLLPLIVIAAPALASAAPRSIKVTSPAFADNDSIPTEYTCEGGNHSPPLAWTRIPTGTQKLAIIMQDPDTGHGTVTHWVVTELDPATTGLRADATLPTGAVVGQNMQGDLSYTGPCPPSGRHHYIFHVYALDTSIGNDAVDAGAFFQKANGHIIAEGELIGTYQKRSP